MVDWQSAIRSGAPELKLEALGTTFEFVRIPSGEFKMGTPKDEVGSYDGEIPRRSVRITQPFYIGRYQITQRQYRRVIGNNPSLTANPDAAVDQILYRMARAFCKRLSDNTQATVTLPTEAQWEYAARAGTTTRYYSGDSERDLEKVAWYSANSGYSVKPVGKKQPNAFGLFDMLGNVFEPCLDWIGDADKLAPVNPVGKVYPAMGGLRGGGWMSTAEECRCGYRMMSNDMFGGGGIRVIVQP